MMIVIILNLIIATLLLAFITIPTFSSKYDALPDEYYTFGTILAFLCPILLLLTSIMWLINN